MGGNYMATAVTDAISTVEEGWDDLNHSRILNKSLRVFFKDALRITLRNPAQAYYFLRTAIWQRRASKTRSHWKSLGVQVPPILIFSVTNRCNLHCKGCYQQALHRSTEDELSNDEMRKVVRESSELGISFFVLAGGEPLVRPEIVDIIMDYPDIIFFMFTNGLLIDQELLNRLKQNRNVVPVLSIEGFEEDTDGRRGQGVFRNLQRIIEMLRKNNIFYSVSITVTNSNIDTVTSVTFIGDLARLGCRFFLFLEYSPIKEGTDHWVISLKQRKLLMDRIQVYRKQYRSLFIAVPGDEEEIGGCLSAGRGFVHIGADGALEPCPFAPFSDANIRNTPLIEALRSDFLKQIRLHHEELKETEGGCALWVKREWVKTLLP
jgi:MoaA/NifB/PqqE/SkfB family radical SAM enzyme